MLELLFRKQLPVLTNWKQMVQKHSEKALAGPLSGRTEALQEEFRRKNSLKSNKKGKSVRTVRRIQGVCSTCTASWPHGLIEINKCKNTHDLFGYGIRIPKLRRIVITTCYAFSDRTFFILYFLFASV